MLKGGLSLQHIVRLLLYSSPLLFSVTSLHAVSRHPDPQSVGMGDLYAVCVVNLHRLSFDGPDCISSRKMSGNAI